MERWIEPNERVWYRRSFDAPARNAGERLLLHFGAVDWSCEVFVNGHEVGAHDGGFDPFHFDITEAVRRRVVIHFKSKIDKMKTTASTARADNPAWHVRTREILSVRFSTLATALARSELIKV